ncbi:MAG: hypothetical protein DMG57_28355 [Acidobacteria bacterium]|nr:MAG: hypothetical protein DMG57_28355 [Acidobacteriota bacterium]
MTSLVVLVLFATGAAQSAPQPPQSSPKQKSLTATMTTEQSRIVKLVHLVAESGRIVEIATSPSARADPRPQIAPGAPPLVSFRMFEGQMRHRFSNLDLVMDDAGH